MKNLGSVGIALSVMSMIVTASAMAGEISDSTKISDLIRDGGQITFTRGVHVTSGLEAYAFGHAFIYQGAKQFEAIQNVPMGYFDAGALSCWITYSTSKQTGNAKSLPGHDLTIDAGYSLKVNTDGVASSVDAFRERDGSTISAFTVSLIGEKTVRATGRKHMDLEAPVHEISCQVILSAAKTDFTVGDLKAATNGLVTAETSTPQPPATFQPLAGKQTVFAAEGKKRAISVRYEALTDSFTVATTKKGFFSESSDELGSLKLDEALAIVSKELDKQGSGSAEIDQATSEIRVRSRAAFEQFVGRVAPKSPVAGDYLPLGYRYAN